MKMLLLSDDFTELKFFKTLFAKFSLDYEISNNPKLIGGLLLSFNPDVIIVSSRSKKFDALRTINELLGKNKKSKYVLLKNIKTEIDDRSSIADFVLDSPPTAASFLDCLVKLGGDRDRLINKIKTETSGASKDSEKTIVSGGASEMNDKVIVKGDTANEDVHVVKGDAANVEVQVIDGDKSDEKKVNLQSDSPMDIEAITEAGDSENNKSSNKVEPHNTSKNEELKIDGEEQDYIMQIVNQSITSEKLINVNDPVRSERYEKILSTIEPIDTKTHLSAREIAKAQKELKAQRNGKEDLEDLNNEKRKFVEVMFTAVDED